MKSKEERQGHEMCSLSQSMWFIKKKLRQDRNVIKITVWLIRYASTVER